jgi:hypothetical protein
VKTNALIIIIMMLSACASQDEATTKDTEQAVRDFIKVRELAEAEQMRTSSNDRWDEIDANFVIYETRREVFLLEFTRACHELDETRVVADQRNFGNTVRAKFDTLRGCRIAKLYPLTEDEVAELEAIGESPGSRN